MAHAFIKGLMCTLWVIVSETKRSVFESTVIDAKGTAVRKAPSTQGQQRQQARPKPVQCSKCRGEVVIKIMEPAKFLPSSESHSLIHDDPEKYWSELSRPWHERLEEQIQLIISSECQKVAAEKANDCEQSVRNRLTTTTNNGYDWKCAELQSVIKSDHAPAFIQAFFPITVSYEHSIHGLTYRFQVGLGFRTAVTQLATIQCYKDTREYVAKSQDARRSGQAEEVFWHKIDPIDRSGASQQIMDLQYPLFTSMEGWLTLPLDRDPWHKISGIDHVQESELFIEEGQGYCYFQKESPCTHDDQCRPGTFCLPGAFWGGEVGPQEALFRPRCASLNDITSVLQELELEDHVEPDFGNLSIERLKEPHALTKPCLVKEEYLGKRDKVLNLLTRGFA